MNQIRTGKYLVLLSITIFFWAIYSPFIFAQSLPCGNIVAPEYFFGTGQGDEDIITIPITDCSDPFEVSGDIPVEYKLLIDDKEVQEDEEIALPSGKTNDIEVVDLPDNLSNSLYLFKHVGNNYEFVSLYLPPPVTGDYIAYASEYFPTSAEADFYSNIYRLEQEGEDTSSYFINTSDEVIFDQNTGESVFNRYQNYIDAATSFLNSRRADISTGTYTLVINLREEAVLGRSWIQELKEFFIARAYAQYIQINLTYTKTFTLTEEEPEPVGASNILFIPGIMGSRLYEESAECSPYQTNVSYEQERWVSFEDCDQLRLKTNYLGQSLNPIYTYATNRALVDEIGLAFGQGPNIYKSLLEDMEEWKEDGLIEDYAVLPYDWRLRIDDLMKMHRDPSTNKITLNSNAPLNQTYVYETISRLAQSAQNEKVTVVAHSNGGLLIKYFVASLEEANDPLLERIQDIVLVAVPQEGTPESIMAALHGIDIGVGGVVMKSEVSRSIIKDSPFGFHLLPTRQYFDTVVTPVISIEEGTATNEWRLQFGDILNSYAEMRSFMVEESSRSQPEFTDVATPAVINEYAFTYKSQLETVLANWLPPEGINVYQIAGTGISTPSGITYFTDTACTQTTLFQCTGVERKLGYRVNTVLDGDGTVVTASALSLSEDDNVKRLWLNLFDYDDEEFGRVHRDILEVEDVRTFIRSVSVPTTLPVYTYLSATSPALGTGNRIIFQLHSPLDMYLELSSGEIVSSSTENIDGATYRRYGELQYISVPEAEEGMALKLSGLATGSFTLDIEQLDNGEVLERQTYSAIPIATTTQVEVMIDSVSAIEEVVLELDYEGDGVVDVSYNTEGVIEEVVTYEDLFAAVEDLSLRRAFEKVLLSTAKTAEKFYELSLRQTKYRKVELVTLQVLKKHFEVYEKIKVITKTQRIGMDEIINQLIDR